MGTLERRIHPIPVSLVPKAAGFSVVEGALGVVEPARCGLSEACPPSCDCGLELRVRFGLSSGRPRLPPECRRRSYLLRPLGAPPAIPSGATLGMDSRPRNTRSCPVAAGTGPPTPMTTRRPLEACRFGTQGPWRWPGRRVLHRISSQTHGPSNRMSTPRCWTTVAHSLGAVTKADRSSPSSRCPVGWTDDIEPLLESPKTGP